MDELQIEVLQTSFHRNGVGGRPFTAVLFTAVVNTGDGERRQRMTAILFDEPGECAVLAIEPLSERGVKFGTNSWRGDHFEDALREAVAAGKHKTAFPPDATYDALVDQRDELLAACKRLLWLIETECGIDGQHITADARAAIAKCDK